MAVVGRVEVPILCQHCLHVLHVAVIQGGDRHSCWSLVKNKDIEIILSSVDSLGCSVKINFAFLAHGQKINFS